MAAVVVGEVAVSSEDVKPSPLDEEVACVVLVQGFRLGVTGAKKD